MSKFTLSWLSLMQDLEQKHLNSCMNVSNEQLDAISSRFEIRL